MLRLVAYGDFNCPFSALASARLAELEQRGLAQVEWRAVEHEPRIPVEGMAMADDMATLVGGELEQIRGLLTEGEPDRLRLPARQVNTRLATERYAGAPTSPLREALFAAHWRSGDDIGDPVVLDRLGAGHAAPEVVAEWRASWEAVADGLVPVLVLPDGYVSRGLGALSRLAGYASAAP